MQAGKSKIAWRMLGAAILLVVVGLTTCKTMIRSTADAPAAASIDG